MMPALTTKLHQTLGSRNAFPIFTAFAGAAILALVPGMVGAQQRGGQSAPPEQANVKPVNHLPNPYETVRNWGVLPDGRTWGSVSAVNVDADGKHIWAADRCGSNSCVGSDVDPIVRLDPGGRVVQSFGAGLLV